MSGEIEATKLFEAAMEGSVSSLQKMLNEDPLILDRFSINCFSDTPLHVAAMLGHVDFVKEIVRTRPHLVNESNSHRSSPLHLASAGGHLDVVKAILSVGDHRSCLARDRNGLTPVHLAALKGHIEVMKTLLRAKPEAAQVATEYGRREENILHLCVKHYRLEPLKLLVTTALAHPLFINSKDSDGNTLLHLAVADKQVETINFLLSVPAFEVNALNLDGMTAVDVLIQSRRDVRDMEIEESLKKGGGIGNLERNAPPPQHMNCSTLYSSNSSSTKMRKNDNTWNGMLKQQSEWLERKKDSLMIVASLIATMAFQVGVNPPGGVWQDDKLFDSQGKPEDDPHEAGISVVATKYPDGYPRFYMINTIGFIASLSIILLLMSGLPIRRRFFMWILMVITWVAITAVAITYLLSITVLTPTVLTPVSKTFNRVVNLVVFGWIGLMALVLVGHTVRLIVRMVKKTRKTFRGRSAAATSSTLLEE
ncbi:hypothetical protein ABFX02_01G079600 [Erythranthe guttata]